MASTEKEGFQHSTPVPRIYKIASKIAKEVKDGRDSLKNLIYKEKHVNIKAVYALVVEAFKRNELIDEILQKSNLLVQEPRFNVWLAKILICELLWGKNKMSGGSKPIDTIFSYEEVLRKALEECEDSVQPILHHAIEKPRYVRVNTLKISTEEAVNNFREEGWVFVPFFDKADYEGFLNRLNNIKPDEFMKDIHIPDLLIFPPKTEFYQHEAYKSGSIVLQDKASCLPVHLLAPTPGSIVLDTCAAPGMKTTQLAALLRNEGTVYAVELSRSRVILLNKLVESVGATCVKTIFKDVMQVTSSDCPDVEYILVDPSCSGSGITDRVEIEKLDLETKMQRLRKLCNFQAKLLRYTMSAFPNSKRIVYSTCSINSEENEDVVRQTLETSRQFKLVDARKILESWNTKTSELYPELGNMCIYATPEQDKTNGFFVAVFERLQEGEKNLYLNFELCKFFDKETNKKPRFNKKENDAKNFNNNHGDSDFQSEPIKPLRFKRNGMENKKIEENGNLIEPDHVGQKGRHKMQELEDNEEPESLIESKPPKKKKVKHSKNSDSILENSHDQKSDCSSKENVHLNETCERELNQQENSKAKKKKRKSRAVSEDLRNNIDIDNKKPDEQKPKIEIDICMETDQEPIPKSKKKKRRSCSIIEDSKHNAEDIDNENSDNKKTKTDTECEEFKESFTKSKKKKKKNSSLILEDSENNVEDAKNKNFDEKKTNIDIDISEEPDQVSFTKSKKKRRESHSVLEDSVQNIIDININNTDEIQNDEVSCKKFKRKKRKSSAVSEDSHQNNVDITNENSDTQKPNLDTDISREPEESFTRMKKKKRGCT